METEQVTESAPQPMVMPSASEEVAAANGKQATQKTFSTDAKEKLSLPEKTVKTEAKQPENGKDWKPTDLNPEQQKLFNGVWKKFKTLERTTQDYENLLKEQSQVIEELRQNQGKVVSHLQSKDFADAESSLKQQRRDARERGDWDTVDEVNDKLEEIRIRKLSLQNQPKQQQTQEKPRVQNAREAAQYAESQGAISADEQGIISAWQDETNSYGEPLRPWSNASDPRYSAALVEARAVFSNPMFQNKSMAEKLAEVDRRMGLETQKSRQEVMGSNVMGAGNLTRQNKNGSMGKVEISDRAANMAVRMKFAGPGKTAEEHIQAYKLQIQQVRGQK